MAKTKIKCHYCGKVFFRDVGRANEAKKFGWNQYCSLKCQYIAKNKQTTFKCGNPLCNKVFKRQPHEIPRSGICFCSNSCSAIFYNSKRRKIRICPICNKQFYGKRKYCSKACLSDSFNLRPKLIKVSKNQIIRDIQKFYIKHGRIPLKREYHHYNATRLRFGTWNKTIKAAGFNPNPAMFAKKYKAKDGHACDSLSEKIIDDWLYNKQLEHKTNVPYPGNPIFTCDFVVGKHFIEFFGLDKVHPRYTQLAKAKRRLAQKHNLNIIELKPEHIFPENKLDTVLDFLLKT